MLARKLGWSVCLTPSCRSDREWRDKAADVWGTASRSHLNLDFTFGSQPLAVTFTEQESVGGRVWPNVIFSDKRFDFAFSVWANSTLGLLSYWWHSSRQQSSKAGVTIRSAETLSVLDFRVLSDDQLIIAEQIFDDFRDKELQARLSGGRRPQPRPPRPSRYLRPLRLRQENLRRRPPPRRQMVRRTLRPRRQTPPQGGQAGYLVTARKEGYTKVIRKGTDADNSRVLPWQTVWRKHTILDKMVTAIKQNQANSVD